MKASYIIDYQCLQVSECACTNTHVIFERGCFVLLISAGSLFCSFLKILLCVLNFRSFFFFSMAFSEIFVLYFSPYIVPFFLTSDPWRIHYPPHLRYLLLSTIFLNLTLTNNPRFFFCSYLLPSSFSTDLYLVAFIFLFFLLLSALSYFSFYYNIFLFFIFFSVISLILSYGVLTYYHLSLQAF